MVRQDLIGRTARGVEFIRGLKKVIFENGVVLPIDEFSVRIRDGSLDYVVMQTGQFDSNYSGYDYAYCKTTGVIRKRPKRVASEPIEEEDIPDPEEVEVKTEKKPLNMFDWVYPKILILITIFCCILSIYFTGTYMMDLQPAVIAYFISVCMLLYGLIGIQMARRALRTKHIIRGIVFGFTACCTIGFSMYTALDVNYNKYMERHEIVMEAEETHQNNNTEYELLKEELEDNKKQIEILSKTYVIMWDAEKKTNVVVEGKITEKAQNSINELNEHNKEINKRLIELAREGTKAEYKETDKAKSIPDLLGAIFGISGNIFQMIILLLPGIFIDLVNVLSITIYNNKFEED